MDPAQTILDLIKADPIALRRAFTDASVLKALKSIGIGHGPDIVVSALHAPGPDARKGTGAGVTLCGENRSVRHPVVTCKHCLRMQGKR